ncbi:hypothetical protein LP419_36320 [Massilia sp. H-1]|nr:hypothetical protein LP419_36320 [Massilia sp. H-1]
MTRFRPLPLPVRALLFQHLAAMEKVGVPAERAYALLDLGPAARPRVQAFQKLTARYRAVRGKRQQRLVHRVRSAPAARRLQR